MKKASLFLIFAFQILFSAQAEVSEPIYQYPLVADSDKRLVYASALMAFLQTTYEPLIVKTSARFRWNFNWQQNYVGAGSNFYEHEFSIMLYGGQVRWTRSNFSVLAATLCHEFGHYLGGQPKQRLSDSLVDDWASAEGQADWFASSQCLPKVYDEFHKDGGAILGDGHGGFEKLCKDSQKPAKCEWLLGTSQQMMTLIQEVFERSQPEPQLLKTALERPPETLRSTYPTLQCRLDTLKQGAFCATWTTVGLTTNRPKVCQRPRCWFVNEPGSSF